jgi:hypothetical protein
MVKNSPTNLFVRARIVTAAGAHRVVLVRVGWLTPELARALAEDIYHTPGSRLDVVVADELTDMDLANLHAWLGWLVSPHGIDVRRAGELSVDGVSPSVTTGRDRLSHGGGDYGGPAVGRFSVADGIGVAHTWNQQRRRSEP